MLIALALLLRGVILNDSGAQDSESNTAANYRRHLSQAHETVGFFGDRCWLGVRVSENLYVLKVYDPQSPMRPGDRLLELHEQVLDRGYETYYRTIGGIAPGTVSPIVVERNGERKSFQVQCENARAYTDGYRRIAEAAASRKWKDCVAAIGSAESLRGRDAQLAGYRMDCAQYTDDAGTPPPYRLAYEMWRLTIDEDQWDPIKWPSTREEVLEALSAFSESGQSRLAEDLRNRIDAVDARIVGADAVIATNAEAIEAAEPSRDGGTRPTTTSPRLTAQSTAPMNHAKNRLTGTCNEFNEALQTGPADSEGQYHQEWKDWAGYTDSRFQYELRWEENTINSQKTTKGFHVCLRADKLTVLPNLKITKDILRWSPSRAVSRQCVDEIERWTQKALSHEDDHEKQINDALSEGTGQLNNAQLVACGDGPTERQAKTAARERLKTQAYDKVQTEQERVMRNLERISSNYHKDNEVEPMRCELCESKTYCPCILPQAGLPRNFSTESECRVKCSSGLLCFPSFCTVPQ